MKLTCVILLLTIINLAESANFLSGGAGKDVVWKIRRSNEFYYFTTDDLDNSDDTHISPFTTPVSTPPDSVSIRFPSFSSNTTSPRTSFSEAVVSKLPFFRSRSSSPINTPAHQEGDLASRPASRGNRPKYLDWFLDLNSVPEIQLEHLPAKPMSNDVRNMIIAVSNTFDNFDESDNFVTDLNRTLTFISQKYVLIPFIVHLAGLMLHNLSSASGSKAPKALELFIETNMPFLAKSLQTPDTDLRFTTIPRLMEYFDDALDETGKIKGFSEKLLDELKGNGHISSAYLNILNQASARLFSSNFDELALFYMIAFNNCKTPVDYARRLAIFTQVLIAFTADAERKNSGVTLKEVNDSLTFDFGNFTMKLYEHFGVAE